MNPVSSKAFLGRGIHAGKGTPKVYRRGTHRCVAPEDTCARVSGLLSALGITRVANVTGLDFIGIPVVMVCRPNSRALSVSQGKGPDLPAARASGLMESIESYHAERIHLPLKLASYNELRFSHQVMDLARLPRPAWSQYNADRRLLWIEGRDLVSGEGRWLPFEAVHTDFRVPPPPGSGCFFTSSSGLASGNHLAEAVSHGICELTERDASSLWHAAGPVERHGRRLDLDSIDDPACREICDKYHRAGVAIAVWETTTDVGLPAFDCVIVEQDLDPLSPLPSAFGAGCHPAREIALMRALTEAAQSRLTSISGSRDDMDRPGHERAHDLDTLGKIHAHITGAKGTRSFRDVLTFDTGSFEDDVDLERKSLEQAGIEEVIVVDLTRPELKIPVVKVVIPGLEFPHRMPGYVPGPRARARAEATLG